MATVVHRAESRRARRPEPGEGRDRPPRLRALLLARADPPPARRRGRGADLAARRPLRLPPGVPAALRAARRRRPSSAARRSSSSAPSSTATPSACDRRGLAQRPGRRAGGRRARRVDPRRASPALAAVSAAAAPARAAAARPRAGAGPGAPLALFLLSGAGALIVETIVAPLAARAVRRDGARRLGDPRRVLPRPGARRRRRVALRRARAAPPRAYGALELAAAAWALAVPWLLAAGEGALRARYDALRAAPAELAALRFAVALAATLPAPSPSARRCPRSRPPRCARAGALAARGGALYGANTLGAALGTPLGSFWLPERFGVAGGYAAGVGALAAAGALALALGRARAAAAPAAPAGAASARPRLALGRATRAAPGDPSAAVGERPPRRRRVLGLRDFAAEVLFVQAFGLVLDQSVYAFGAVLVVVLVALASAPSPSPSRAGAAWRRRALLSPRAPLSALALARFPARFLAATGGLAFLASGRPWPGYLWAALGIAAATAGPALLAARPRLSRRYGGRRAAAAGPRRAARLGRLAAANTAGALAGALAAPYLLLPGARPLAALRGARRGLRVRRVRRSARGRSARARAPLLLGAAAALLALSRTRFEVPALRLEPRRAPRRARPDARRGTSRSSIAAATSASRSTTTTRSAAARRPPPGAPGTRRAAAPTRRAARGVDRLGHGHQRGRGARAPDRAARASSSSCPGSRAAARRFFAESNRARLRGPAQRGRARRRPELPALDRRALRRRRSGPLRAVAGGHGRALDARALRGGARAPRPRRPLLPVAPALSARRARAAHRSSRASSTPSRSAALFRGDFYGRFPIVALVGFEGAAPAADADLGGRARASPRRASATAG